MEQKANITIDNHHITVERLQTQQQNYFIAPQGEQNIFCNFAYNQTT